MAHKSTNIELPLGVVTIVDLSRLEQELASLEDFGLQSEIREAGKQPKLPKTSHGLEELASENGFNLLLREDCQQLIKLLKDLKDQAPVIHLSFASDPTPVFLSKIISWFRSQIHPHILLQVGLQPSIAAGCVLRTTNKYFDFSLRKHFEQKHQMLIDELAERKSQSVG